MPARESRPITLALAYMQRHGEKKPADVAARYGVSVSSIYRAMERAGMQKRPRGRPRKDHP